MSTTEAADLARTILRSLDGEADTTTVNARVADLRAVAHAVIRMDELADRLDDGHLRHLIRTTLNGETDG